MTQICYGVFQCLLYHYFQTNETLGYNKHQNSENFSLLCSIFSDMRMLFCKLPFILYCIENVMTKLISDKTDF